MPTPSTSVSRKKILRWGAALIASAAAFRVFRPGPKKQSSANSGEKKETVTMLTQDGKLVEINRELLAAASNKITNEELQTWIKK